MREWPPAAIYMLRVRTGEGYLGSPVREWPPQASLSLRASGAPGVSSPDTHQGAHVNVRPGACAWEPNWSAHRGPNWSAPGAQLGRTGGPTGAHRGANWSAPEAQPERTGGPTGAPRRLDRSAPGVAVSIGDGGGGSLQGTDT